MKPFETKNQDLVPCGKCPSCLKRRASAWSFRLMQQMKAVDSAHFITLTYDTKYVPITPNGFMELRKRDVQLFFKRLRKSVDSSQRSNAQDCQFGNESARPVFRNIKYFAVGEYGGKTKRPHYHIILFNAPLELIQPAWGLGHVHYGTVNEASVGYTLKYMMKPTKIPMHRNDDRQPEFQLMSKGLGLPYITESMIAWHHEDKNNRFYCQTLDGKKIAMPRYYKNKIYDDFDRQMIGKYNLEKLLNKQSIVIDKLGIHEYERQKAISVENEFKKLYNMAEKGRKI